YVDVRCALPYCSTEHFFEQRQQRRLVDLVVEVFVERCLVFECPQVVRQTFMLAEGRAIRGVLLDDFAYERRLGVPDFEVAKSEVLQIAEQIRPSRVVRCENQTTRFRAVLADESNRGDVERGQLLPLFRFDTGADLRDE